MALRALSKAELLIIELHYGLHYCSIIAATARREGKGEWREHKSECKCLCGDVTYLQISLNTNVIYCACVSLAIYNAFGRWSNYDRTHVASMEYVVESGTEKELKKLNSEDGTCASHVRKRHKHETWSWLGLASALFDDEIVFNYYFESISCTTVLLWALSSPWLLSWPALWCHR